MQAGLPNFVMSVSEWIESTNAIGLIVRKGKYGGAYAQKDIAFEFGTAISVYDKPFKVPTSKAAKAKIDVNCSAFCVDKDFTQKYDFAL